MQVSFQIEGGDEALLVELAKAAGASIEETARSIVAAVLDDDARAHAPDKMHKMHMHKLPSAAPNRSAQESERIEELEEEVRQLREQLSPTVAFPAKIGLTPIQTKILAFILARSPNVALRERIHFAVYPDPVSAPDLRLIDVMMVKIRRALARYGVTIGTVFGEGFILADSEAAVLRGWLDGVTPVESEVPASEGRRGRRAKAAAPLIEPGPALKAEPPAPASEPEPAPEPEIGKAQIKSIRAFASVGNSAAWIAREIDLPVSLVKSILKGK